MIKDLNERLTESVEYVALSLSRKVESKWVLETDDVPGAIDLFVKKLEASLPDLTTSVLDISEYPDTTSIRSALNQAATGSGERLLIINGLEDIDEKDLNVGLGDFLNSLGDIYSPNYPYTYEKSGLSLLIVVQSGSHNHFVRYCLTQEGGFGLLH